ncbi:MAG TPA: dienelactone hydrolase family protein [Polyangia bacterium]|nr:dienelactone hydrolase family protein [Polyangia bacterium]
MYEDRVAFESDERSFQGVVFQPAGDAGRSQPAVLVLHGGAGPGAHERARARMLAELGYVAFVPDLFGEVFATRERGIAVITDLVANPSLLRGRLSAALASIAARPGVDPARVAALGFCFGGHAALELARSGASIQAAVSIHGGLISRAPAVAGQVRASILVCTGAADPFVTREHRSTFEHEMSAAQADWQMHLYSGAMHGFSEQAAPGAPGRPGVGYDPNADRRSWAAGRELLRQTLESTSAAL